MRRPAGRPHRSLLMTTGLVAAPVNIAALVRGKKSCGTRLGGAKTLAGGSASCTSGFFQHAERKVVLTAHFRALTNTGSLPRQRTSLRHFAGKELRHTRLGSTAPKTLAGGSASCTSAFSTR